jgi:hypothetical protein
LPPLPVVAQDGYNPLTGQQQVVDAKDDDETMTVATGMTWHYNVLDVEDIKVNLIDGDGANEDEESRDSGTCVSLFGKRVATEEEVQEMLQHLRSHPFRPMKTVISKWPRLTSLGKDNFHLNEEKRKPAIRSFLKKLLELESYVNKKKGCFTKCTCLKRLHILGHAAG